MINKAEDLIPIDLEIKKIYRDDIFNCRGPIILSDCVSLANDIKREGLQCPITVQPYTEKSPFEYRVVVGHRRLTAFKINKAETIPAIIAYGLTEQQARIKNLNENIKRKDLNPLQEAKGIEDMKNRGIPIADVAKLLEVSTGWVRIRYLILELPEAIQKEVAAGLIKLTMVEELSSLPFNEMASVVRQLRDDKITGDRTDPIAKILDKKKALKQKNKEKCALKQEPRGIAAIEDMQTVIREAVGNSLPTRALAWAAGHINDYELYLDIKSDAERKGIDYKIPVDIIKLAQEAGLIKV